MNIESGYGKKDRKQNKNKSNNKNKKNEIKVILQESDKDIVSESKKYLKIKDEE